MSEWKLLANKDKLENYPRVEMVGSWLKDNDLPLSNLDTYLEMCKRLVVMIDHRRGPDQLDKLRVFMNHNLEESSFDDPRYLKGVLHTFGEHFLPYIKAESSFSTIPVQLRKLYSRHGKSRSELSICDVLYKSGI